MTRTNPLIRNSPQDATVTILPAWGEWLSDETLHALIDHPLLQAMRSGCVSLEGMRQVLTQHHFYARHFTRFLCAMISRLDSLDDIKLLMENLLEELGVEGDHDVTHAELFQKTLRSVGATPLTEAPLPQTTDLARTILGLCRHNDPAEGLAALCLGAEAIVPLIYPPMLTALEHLGISEAGQEFFRLHINEDEGHALKMLGILQRMTDQSPARKMHAIAAGRLAIAKRCDMFDAIWQKMIDDQCA